MGYYYARCSSEGVTKNKEDKEIQSEFYSRTGGSWYRDLYRGGKGNSLGI